MLRLLLLAAPLAQGLKTAGSAAESKTADSLAESGLDMDFFTRLAPPSTMERPTLVQPADVRRDPPRGKARHRHHRAASLIESAAAEQGARLGTRSRGPALGQDPAHEYNLESEGAIGSFSSARQDVKLLTQVLVNVTEGFFLDANAGDGETGSNTLLLELLGWRGLCVEPRTHQYMLLWAKLRKAWLFLGALSPRGSSARIGFTEDGDVDQLSGHRVHAYPVKGFLVEMVGRKTIDFWNLRSGGYEAEILNETLLHSGRFIEFGVILVTYSGRDASRGTEAWALPRTREETEHIVFDIANNASFQYIGGLDTYWINEVEPRYGFKDAVFVNPSYFDKRGIPTPTSIKATPPPPLSLYSPAARKRWPGFAAWDAGFSEIEEAAKIEEYLRMKVAAPTVEDMTKADAAQTVDNETINYAES
jgi:hypothetical protein